MSAAQVVPTREPDSESAWARVLDLACTLTVDVPLARFRVGDLLQLNSHPVVASEWRTGVDVALRVNGVIVAWCEFEVVGHRLAVRITELA